MRKLLEKQYYYVQLELISPLSIGGGDSIYSDHDIILDNQGLPFIPGTTLAGVFNHYLNEEQRKLFNPIKRINGLDTSVISPFFISNAQLISSYHISIRDGIALDKEKATIKGAKYDYQVIDTGAVFDFRIEIKIYEDDNADKMENIIHTILSGIELGEIRFGYKTNRGFGKAMIKNVYRKTFNQKALIESVDFNELDTNQYENFTYKKIDNKRFDRIEVILQQKGGISIRNYALNASEVDFEHIKCGNQPIIPGTSWNGMIRKQLEYYCRTLGLERSVDLKKITGDVSKEMAMPSAYVIEESVIEKGKELLVFRNKIDRFSGGTQDQALFNELAYYNGCTKLNINVRSDISEKKELLGLFALVIKDIENGLIAVGGQTSIGRGLFEVKDVKLNGLPFDMNDSISYLRGSKV